MRRLLLVFAAAGLMLAVLAPMVAGDGGNKFKASLNGYLETPSVSTAGSGSFRLRIHKDLDRVHADATGTSRLRRSSPTSTSVVPTWLVASRSSCAAAAASPPARQPHRAP